MPPRLRSAHDRDILRLAVPALGALVAEPLYILADTAVVGRLGTPQLGGLALASSVLLTLHAVFIFLAYGTTAAVARHMGAGDPKAAATAAVQSVHLAVVLSLGVVLVGGVFGRSLLAALGAEGDVLAHGEVYLRISLLGVPALLVSLAAVGWLRGVQDTRTPLVVAAVTAAGNLALEVVLVFGLGHGIGASALSTVVAQCAGAAVYLRFVVRGARDHGAPLAPHAAQILGLAKVGRDLLVRTLALRLALLAATSTAARLGVVDLAAHQVAFEVWSFLALVLDAIAIAGQALVGYRVGAGDAAGARAVGDRMLTWGVAVGAVLGVAVLLARGLLPPVFTDDEQVRALTAFLLVWVALLQPVNGLAFALDGLLIGAGDQRFMAIAMVGVLVLFLPAVAVVGAAELGIGWLWAALGGLMAARYAVLVVRWRSDRWMPAA